ncbi:MAG: helix-turn-helix domain-containing protein [Alphaproteobacteria bacterium]|nr:helix-turn-helix domain-containing protein [Alphaproteobacteria bacterium]
MATAPHAQARQLTKLRPMKPKFRADGSWFHVFRDYVHSGACAGLGPYATTILIVIKSFTNFETGYSFPSIQTICELSGISRRQVLLSLASLEQAGFLTKIKEGKSNSYRVRERVQINDHAKRPVAVAIWDYLPRAVKQAQAELQNFVLEGNVSDGSPQRVIYIEQLCLNLQIVESGGTGTQIIVGKTNDR